MTIHWEVLIAAIAAIETGGNAAAVGDGGRAHGPLQIHQCVVDDVNRIANLHLDLDHARDPYYARIICELYLKYWSARMDRDPTIADIARIWNGGPWGPSKKSTEDYGSRVTAKYHELLRDPDVRLDALIAQVTR